MDIELYKPDQIRLFIINTSIKTFQFRRSNKLKQKINTYAEVLFTNM